MSDLPDPMPPVLADALRAMPESIRQRFIDHLREGTSCDYLSDWLNRNGTPVSATTLKRYRASIVQ